MIFKADPLHDFDVRGECRICGVDAEMADVACVPTCPECGGEGVIDSGGVTPWMAPIDLPCPACAGRGTR